MNGYRILVVDDDALVRRVVRRIAAEFGDARAEADGASALRVLETSAFDLVVSDIRMPPPDGLELAVWLREHQPDTRVLLVSGFANAEDESTIADLGASLLRKPFDARTLRDAIAGSLAPARDDSRP